MKYLVLQQKTSTVAEVAAAARKAGVADELRTALEMDFETASTIVGEMLAFGTGHMMGATPTEIPACASRPLAELVEANRVVREHREAGRIHTHCDDRITAAMYAAWHFEPSHPDAPEPIVVGAGRALFLVDVRRRG